MRKGIVARHRPREYQITETQKSVKEAAEVCGIRKGMTRTELRTAMRECIPKYWKDKEEGKGS